MSEGTDQATMWARLRWSAVIIYLILVLLISFLPFAIEPTVVYWWFYLAVVGLGTMGLMFLVLAPLFMGERASTEPDAGPEEVVDTTIPLLIYQRFTLMIWIVVGTVAYGLLMIVLEPGAVMISISGGLLFFMVLLLALFSHLYIHCDSETLTIGYPVFKRRMALADIASIEEEHIRWLRDYLGLGVRVGPQRTLAFITWGGPGFRVTTNEGKSYVASIKDPMRVVNYVRSARQAAGLGSD